MKELFYTQSVYMGYDLKEFNDIRDILDKNRIGYRHKVHNRLGKIDGIGRGTVRGRSGSLGVPSEKMYQYEIRVKKSEYEKARYFISNKKGS